MKKSDITSVIEITGSEERKESRSAINDEWRTTFDCLSDLVSVHNKDFKIVKVNKAFIDFCGQPAEKLIGRTCHTLLHSDKKRCPNCPHKKTLETKKPATAEIFEPSLGHYFEISTSPIFDKSGQVIGSVHIAKDITDRKTKELALKESEEKFRTIFESAADGIILANKNAKILDLNQMAEKILGSKRNEIIGKHFTQSGLLKPKDLPNAIKMFYEILKNGARNHLLKIELQRKDGHKIFVEISPKLIKKNGEIEGIISVIRDVTQCKMTEKRLQESEERYRTLVENSPDAIALTDLEGNLLMINHQTAKLHGFANEKEVLSKIKHALELITTEDRERALANVKKVLKKGKVEKTEYSMVRKNGTTFPGELSIALIRDSKGNPKALVGQARDITERQKIEEKLASAAEEWRTTFDSITDLVSVHDKNFEIVRVNKAFAKSFGKKPEELIGKKCFEVVHGTKECLPDCPHKKTLKTKKPLTIELFEPQLQIDVEISASPIFGGKNEVVGSVHIIKDITDRKKMNDELKKINNFNKSILNNVGLGITVTRMDGKLISVNKGTEKIFGYRATELLGKNISILYPDNNQKMRAMMREHALKKGRFEDDVSFLRKNGQEFSAHLIVTPFKDEKGKIAGFILTSEDMTETKKMEQALEKSQKRYQTLVETSTDCICHLNLDGNFLYMSPAGLKSHNMALDELKGKHCTELATPPYHDLLKETLEKAKRGEHTRFQYQSDTISGVRWIESRLTPIKNESGKVISLLRLSRDITNQKEAEENLKNSFKKLEKTLRDTTDALASMAEKRDPYTAGHQKGVARIACAVAAEMGLPGKQVEGIGVACLVHDIGKITIPAEILNKPGSLTEIEFNMIKTHSKIGYEVLKTIDFPWPVAEIVLQHHERIDGSGYPSGLAGDEILLEAKILGVADVVEAMSSHRPYRPALGLDKALKEISGKKDILFDSKVVETCLRLFNAKTFSFE